MKSESFPSQLELSTGDKSITSQCVLGQRGLCTKQVRGQDGSGSGREKTMQRTRFAAWPPPRLLSASAGPQQMRLVGLVWIPPRPSAEEHRSHGKWPAPPCIWAQKAKLRYLDGVLPRFTGGQPGLTVLPGRHMRCAA